MSDGIDQAIDSAFEPIATAMVDIVFVSVNIGGTELPLIVVWLVVGAVFFTGYFRFINIRGFTHAIRIVTGKEDKESQAPGEVSHFQALTTAVSGTVGVGNVVHVAVAISIGGPGATFWLIVAGFLGMASKFVECTLGVKYRQTNPDGSISGGPMFYMDKGFAELNMPRLGKTMAWYYALCVMLGSLGAGCMFQANQAYVQVVSVSGGESSFFAERGWLFGTLLAILTAMVIVGGIKSIARVTSRLVPFMALLYMSFALIVIGANYEKLPGAIISIFTNAFSPEGVTGGAIAVLVLGFRRAAFSNEAGIGSSAIAHAAVKTKEPLTQGFVAMLEPFIDTVVVCTITALVITVTVYDPAMLNDGVISGVELTSAAFASVMPWFPYVLAVVIMLFAYSTMISWSYYGLEGFVYMFGPSRISKLTFNMIFCLFVVIGCTTQLTAVLDFSDAMIFAMALANILALYVLGPGVKRDLDVYWQRRAS
ncbi:MAG: alanine:cation symporter family protein [Gammaproteobacteria bacterium]|jgi:AGCS family alanine or glycine:cation symporter|nr:alanine:cation symporter family protein [Gammaproteobacteria bacterium]MBT5154319.1 alanine:cation symporter family protein [Gammaproteobacteria bacterium]MBT6586626.1 alanine:cation symporter family protein [Gammaproteobacteria bacterium]MBT6893606.1 alanine:cation symporter family protein [Gammaproteobacteria bacterium]MBT7876503.1 alanine:cation symporter family protein [Gammaproteobacteria bacterium]